MFFAGPMAVVGLVAAVSRMIDQVREKKRRTGVLEGLGRPVPGPDLVGIVARSVVTLEGDLVCAEGASPPIVSFHPYGTSFLDEPNAYAITHLPNAASFAVALDGGGRVLLEGPMQVLAGSVESEHRAPLDKARAFDAEALAGAPLRTRIGQFRSVRTGDRVRIRGAVEPAPDDDALYRARSSVLRMSPEGHEGGANRGAISVAAIAPSTTKRLSRRTALAGGLIAAVATGSVLVLMFNPPMPHGRSAEHAATPSPTTPNACRANVLAELEANKPIEAATVAKGCDDPYAQAVAHFANGNFTEASAAFGSALTVDPELTPSISEAEAHLFAHDYERAAGVVHRMATRFYPGPSTAEKRYLECIGALLDDRAAQAHGGKGPYVEPHPGKKYRKICSTRPFAKFARELDAEGGYWGDDDWLDFSAHTYLDDAGYDIVGNPFTAAVGTRARLTARPVGIEKSLLDRLILAPGPGRPPPYGSPQPYGGRLDLFFGSELDYYPRVATFAAELTLFYAYAGFPERSARYWPMLDTVASVMEADPPKSFHVVTTEFAWEKTMVEAERNAMTYTMSIAAAAALLSNDAARTKRYAAQGEVHSAHVVRQLESTLKNPAVWEEPAEDGHWADHKALFDAASTRDGADVVAVLKTQRTTGRDTLARIVPRIRRNRAELDAWFKGAFPAPCLTCGASDYFGHVSDRREVARLLGDTQESERLRPVAEHFTDALTDVSIAFELDELETFFGRKH